MFLPHFDVFCDLLLNQTHGNMESICFKIFQHNTKAGPFAPPLNSLCTKKKVIWRDLWSIRNEAISLVAMRSKELWLVEKNHATVKPNWSVASRGIKTELWTAKSTNLEKKCWKNGQFLSSKQPCELNSLNVALDIAGVEKSQLRKFTVAINTGGHSIRVLNKRSVSVGGNLCPLWLEILKSLWYSVGDTL